MEIAVRSLHAALAARAAMAAGAVLLAFEPLVWLIRTWTEPAYDSDGFLVFAICAVLFLWSATSEPVARRAALRPGPERLAIGLLLATALIRLAGQLSAVNTIGALALIADVYAIGLLAGLHRRRRAVSPAWLAACFAFSLPLERIIQRTLGFPLQHLSADGACLVLRGLYDRVECEGVRILLQGRDVLVDLPCSGAQALLLLLLFFCVMAAFVRPGAARALLGLAVTLAAAIAANVVRIAILAIGISLYPSGLSFDVMAQPWHDLIGLAILGLAVTPVVVWARFPVRAETMPFLQHERPRPRHGLRPDYLSAVGFAASRPGAALAGALVFLAGAATIGLLPRHAIDVGARDVSVVLPDRIDGRPAEPVALTTPEKDYFVRFGGAAAKARYGSASLLVVRTSSPLRHLHAPDDCLRGLGFDVDYLGLGHDPLPTAFYGATSPDGTRYRVEVSFVSDRGHVVANVAEASWIWLQQPSTVWTAVQRIMPAEADDFERNAFARGVIAALDLPTGHGPAHHPVTLAFIGESR